VGELANGKRTLFAVTFVMTAGLLLVNPNRNVGHLPLVVRIGLLGVVGLEGLFQRKAIFLRDAAQRDDRVWLMGVLDVARPTDDQLLARCFERADTGDHGAVTVADGERPLGWYGRVPGFRQRYGIGLGWDDGNAIDDSGFSWRGLRGAWEVALWRTICDRRYDGKVMAYMEDTAGEFDALRGEIGLLLEDVFAGVLEGDLGQRWVGREAVHWVGEEEERWRGNGQVIGESYKLFSKEVEPEKEGAGGMSPGTVICVNEDDVCGDLHVQDAKIETFVLLVVSAGVSGSGWGSTTGR